MTRVLITAAGRRNYLVNYFKAAGATVVVTDAVATAPAFLAADEGVLAPVSDSPEYVQFVTETCRQYAIDLIISVNDYDLAPLSSMKHQLKQLGVAVVVADPEVVTIASDKLATNELAASVGASRIPTWTTAEDALSSPAEQSWIVKPRFGSGSVGLVRANDRGALAAAVLLATSIQPGGPARSDVVIQRQLEGAEYGLDILNDLNGNHVATWVKLKRRMRAGETDVATIVQDDQLSSLGSRIAAALRHPGVLDVDVIRTADGSIYVLDLNPRFGGGYPFSHAAGANAPACLLAWATNSEVDPDWLQVRYGTTAAKFDSTAVVSNS